MFHASITQEEIYLVKKRLNDGIYDNSNNPLWVETAEMWYDRNVKNFGEENAIKNMKAKAAIQKSIDNS